MGGYLSTIKIDETLNDALSQIAAVHRLLRAIRVLLRAIVCGGRAVPGHEPGSSHAPLGRWRKS